MVRSQFDVLGRWLEVESVTEYDESHNMTYKLMNYKSGYLTYNNGEQWFTHDDKGRLIYVKKINGSSVLGDNEETW